MTTCRLALISRQAIGVFNGGDVLMVTSTDRLARTTRDLLNILHSTREAGAGFRSFAEPMVATTSQFAEVIITALGIAANYERHRITERIAAGRGYISRLQRIFFYFGFPSDNQASLRRRLYANFYFASSKTGADRFIIL